MSRKWRKWTYVGNQHGLDFLIQVCHTIVSIWQDLSTTYMGRLHAYVYSTALTTGWSNRTRACHTVEPYSEKATFEGS
ncbi:Tumor necrosis factor receptor superfamily member 21 [Gossypium arboreum]|uniref:Tumor necrosis factor receptor superfamily member 21 n=1 Tax=Gossypium arboreum TaxID=29729 RepID=A0A0B0PEL6_GOSAR|nr:Tumor necrosis factor receptor superfamily member 21 [Gossypium arboreum]